MFKQDCEHCQKPGNPKEDHIIAVGPDGKVAWWARKDCPIHGVQYIQENGAGGAVEPVQ